MNIFIHLYLFFIKSTYDVNSNASLVKLYLFRHF